MVGLYKQLTAQIEYVIGKERLDFDPMVQKIYNTTLPNAIRQFNKHIEILFNEIKKSLDNLIATIGGLENKKISFFSELGTHLAQARTETDRRTTALVYQGRTTALETLMGNPGVGRLTLPSTNPHLALGAARRVSSLPEAGGGAAPPARRSPASPVVRQREATLLRAAEPAAPLAQAETPLPAAAPVPLPPPPPAQFTPGHSAARPHAGGARKKSRKNRRNNRKNRKTKRNRAPMKSKHQKRRNNGRMSSRK